MPRHKETIKVIVAGNDASIAKSDTTYENLGGNSPRQEKQKPHTEMLIKVKKKSWQKESLEVTDTALNPASKFQDSFNNNLKSKSPVVHKDS